MKNDKIKWLVFSIGGLVTIEMGMSFFGESVSVKMHSENWTDWFWIGTLSLVLINAGLSLIGRGIIHKIKHGLRK